MHERCFRELPKENVSDCLCTFAREFQLDPGFLRPDDSLMVIFAPVRTWNPLKWLYFRGLEGDAAAELEALLAKRLRERGISPQDMRLRTFGDFVRAWASV